jgi:hypothetical protein
LPSLYLFYHLSKRILLFFSYISSLQYIIHIYVKRGTMMQNVDFKRLRSKRAKISNYLFFVGMCRLWQTSRLTSVMQERGWGCHLKGSCCPDTYALCFQIRHCSGTGNFTRHCGSSSLCPRFDKFGVVAGACTSDTHSCAVKTRKSSFYITYWPWMPLTTSASPTLTLAPVSRFRTTSTRDLFHPHDEFH